jgi:hypothetical protein
MTPDCFNIRSIIPDVCLITACDVVRDGSLRLATPLFYPDGSHIDVFLNVTGSDEPAFELSDKGQTMAYLLDLHVKPWTSQKRKQTLADICSTLGVKQEGGAFQIQIKQNQMKDLSDAILRLAQVCIRVADLAYTQRLRSPAALTEDFEEFIISLDRPYQSNVNIVGEFGNFVDFDFLVEGRSMQSLVQILSTANQSAAHTLSNEAFTHWYDITPVRPQYQCLTVFDTRNNVFRDEDLRRLRTVSDVVGFPAETNRLNVALLA